MSKLNLIKLSTALLSACLIIAVSLLLSGTWGDADAQGSGMGSPQGPVPVSVQIIRSEPTRIWKEFSGRLVAVDIAEIRPQVSGRILEVNFEDGQYVEEGDVLFVIEPREFEAGVMQAKANLRVAQSEYSLADKEFKRAKELIKNNAISQRTYDERKSQLNLVLAQIHAAKAEVEQAQINLDRANVTAPISGRTSRVEITLGNLIEAGPNAPVVTTIIADEKIYADFELDEQTYVEHIRNGANGKDQESQIPVEVFLRGEKTNAVKGKIHAFDNQIDPDSGTIRARAILDNASGALLPGMFARVRLGSAGQSKQMLVDETALGTDQDRKFVYVVNDQNMVEYREISIGERVGTQRVVTSGLSGGEKVINAGLIKIRPGMPVKPQEAQQGAEKMPPPPTSTPAVEPAEAPTPAETETADTPQEQEE